MGIFNVTVLGYIFKETFFVVVDVSTLHFTSTYGVDFISVQNICCPWWGGMVIAPSLSITIKLVSVSFFEQ